MNFGDEITPQLLYEMMNNNENFCIVDVRTLEEIETASFPHALHIPLYELAQSVAKIPQEKIVITLCHHGARSLKACYLLKEKGFDKVASLKGGIDLWSQVIDPKIPRY